MGSWTDRRCRTCTASCYRLAMQGSLLSSFLGYLTVIRAALLTLRQRFHHFFNILTLTLQEFLVATDMPTSGSPKEKLQWIFEMYDTDGSGKIMNKIVKKHVLLTGSIGLDEMPEILSTLHDMEGANKFKQPISPEKLTFHSRTN